MKDQIEKIKEELDLWPESALLNLGRIMEIWLLVELQVKVNHSLSFLIKEAELRNIIDKHHLDC